MMFVVLSESHSSIGNLKRVGLCSIDRRRVFTAGRISFTDFALNCSKDQRAFSIREHKGA